MSFRGQHNQYSPYYQQIGVEQDGSGSGNSTGNTYQPAPYQPPSAYQSRPSQPTAQSGSASTSFYGDQGYENLSSGGNAPLYGGRNGYRSDRSSIDTTNLGNLAYASSLNRTTPSPQQSYSQENSTQYGLNAAGSASRVESRTTSGFGTDPSRRLPPTHTQYTSQNYNTNTGRSSPAQPQYSITTPSQQANRQYAPTQQVAERTNSSAQERNHTSSRSASSSNPPPRFVPVQETSFQPAGHQSQGGQDHPQPQLRNTDPPVVPRSSFLNGLHPSSRPQQSTAGQQGNRPVTPSSGPQQGNVSNAYPPVIDTIPQTNQKTPFSKTHTQVPRQQSPQPAPVQQNYPTTVDPSQVFDDIEYRRRKEEEIERRHTAEATRNVQAAALADKNSLHTSQPENSRAQLNSPKSNDVLEAATATIQGRKASGESTTKDQMELEMKQMIEKMRDYKAKDPSLFSQIWEQVKKGQAPQASSTKPVVSPSSASPTVTNGQLNSPVLSDNPAESEPSTASESPPDFDRGRFPYQRRRRGGAVSAGYKHSKSHHKVPVPVTEQPATPTPQMTAAPLREQAPSTTPQVPVASSASTVPAVSQTATASSVPVARMVPGRIDETEHRLLAAMHTFHQSLPLPTPAPAQSRMPPINSDKPTVSPTSVENTRPMAKAFQGKTQWPENKKRALAEAAVTFLKWNPANAGKQINANEIHELLDSNPSYTEMCELLTYKGFVVERGHFARFLLSAVPDMGNSSSPNSIPRHEAPPAASVKQQSAPIGGQQPISRNFQRPPNDRPMMGPQQVYVSGKVFSAPIFPVPIFSGPNDLPKPPTKEDKARKRNFSEIVDLTQDLSGDEDAGRHQKSRLGENAQDLSVDPAKITVSKKNNHAQGATYSASHEIRASSTSREQLLREKVSEPMNKRRDARRCSSYDPKTIARDILISSGKHPTMAPLNHHLDILREKFDSVNHDTDLSTFRWDMVDPPEKPPEIEATPATLADIMNQTEDLRDDENDEDILSLVTNSVGRAGPPRRGRPKKRSSHTLSDSGNGLQFDSIAPPNAQRFSSRPMLAKFKLSKATVDNARVVTSHQHALHAGGPYLSSYEASRTAPSHEKSSGTIQSSGFTPAAISNVPFYAGKATTTPHPPSNLLPGPGARCLRCRRQHSVCNSQKPCSRCDTAGIGADDCVYVESSKGNITPQSSQRRIGRPPRAKNKKSRPDKGIPKGPKAPSVLISGRVGPSPLENPSRKSSESQNAISPTSSIAVVIPQLSPHLIGTGAPHQGKSHDSSDVNHPVYKSYKCNWDQCPAELHNLETLRKHVRKHRKGIGSPIPCKMLECTLPTDGIDGENWMTFEDDESWDRHVKQKHIRMIAQSQGDVLSGESDEDLYD